ncbi:DUF4157 domain-containing protein [Streptomyces sp. NBC_00554]|uniref:eCIS core domain-containing protein n=1 Tax=Streptomyces sp. NBC_00554 TaxID=2903661 RepID=UPI00352F7CDF|nr:DUF4157 domain-containing protein [Streptomyces sp. NBC_00554]
MMRSTMEGLLGYDLSDVRIHSDGAAATSARRMEARAYTVGDDIVLGGDVPSLRTRAGQHALAHELIHVVQQRLGGPAAGAEVDSPFEQDAEAAAMALADGRKPPPVVRGTAVGVARQPMDPRHARGYAGEQAMGFTHYKESEGWIFFEGPSGAGGHGVTQSGFDGVAYNTRTGEVHLADNKSLAVTGNVSSATAIDPARNLGKNLDGLIQRVEATKDVPGRIRLLGLLRQTRAALTTGKPLPPAVKLVVTSEGGRTTGVSARLAAAGVEHLPPKPAPSAPLPPPPSTSAPTAKPTPTPSTPPPVEVPQTPTATPTTAPVVEPSPTTAPVVEPSPTPVVTPSMRPASPWRAGLKAGGQALAWALVFAGLSYLVHKRLAEQLERDIDMSRQGSMPWARRTKADNPSKPVYLTITVRSEEYSRYVPLLGWMPESPRLFLAGIEISDRNVDPPSVVVEDHSLDILRPGKTVTVTYSELRIP